MGHFKTTQLRKTASWHENEKKEAFNFKEDKKVELVIIENRVLIPFR